MAISAINNDDEELVNKSLTLLTKATSPIDAKVKVLVTKGDSQQQSNDYSFDPTALAAGVE